MGDNGLSEKLSRIFGRDGGAWAAGAMKSAKAVQTHGEAIRVVLAQLEAMSIQLDQESERLKQYAEATMQIRKNEKDRLGE